MPKRTVLLFSGFLTLIIGVVLILACWREVVMLMRASVGLVLALAGLFILYAASKD